MGTVNLTGGRFAFGQTTLTAFNTINAIGGGLVGKVTITGVNDVASLTALQNSAVDLNDVATVNEGLLHGSAILNSSLANQDTGKLRTTSSDWVRFEGSGKINAGEINNFGGQVDFAQDMTNENGGFIGGRGQFVADGGWTNQGLMAFSGTTDILGDVVNDVGGQIITLGGTTMTIFDDLEHNGQEIRTGVGSRTVVFGQASGTGAYNDVGIVEFAHVFAPGNSSGTVSFGGDLVLGSVSATQIELGGLFDGGDDKSLTEFDWIDVTGNVELAGLLNIELIDGFKIDRGNRFDFVRVGGTLTGQYDGLGEGALVGNFGGQDLFITYTAGGSTLYTIPEPTTLLLALLAIPAAPLRVRCG